MHNSVRLQVATQAAPGYAKASLHTAQEPPCDQGGSFFGPSSRAILQPPASLSINNFACAGYAQNDARDAELLLDKCLYSLPAVDVPVDENRQMMV
jgi:hypothetical protein